MPLTLPASDPADLPLTPILANAPPLELTVLGGTVRPISMGVVGPWVGFGAWWLLRRTPPVAIFVAMTLANLSTYVTTAMQLAVAFPDPVSRCRTMSGSSANWRRRSVIP